MNSCTECFQSHNALIHCGTAGPLVHILPDKTTTNLFRHAAIYRGITERSSSPAQIILHTKCTPKKLLVKLKTLYSPDGILVANPWGASSCKTKEDRSEMAAATHVLIQHQPKYFQGQVLFYRCHLHSIFLSVAALQIKHQHVLSKAACLSLSPRFSLSHLYAQIASSAARHELDWCNLLVYLFIRSVTVV